MPNYGTGVIATPAAAASAAYCTFHTLATKWRIQNTPNAFNPGADDYNRRKR